MKKLSKVEVKGAEAYFYDELMQVLSGFSYNRFINKAVQDLHIKNNEKILDLGSGSGKNICIMNNYTKNLIVGFDKGSTMLAKSKKRCKPYGNVKIFYHDIREPSPFYEDFDLVFISFALHGFVDNDRDKIIKNAYNYLKKGGRLCILDYNEFNIDEKNIFIKYVFKYGECPLASEFININLREKLSKFGFNEFRNSYYYSNLVRLAVAYK